MEGKNGSKTSNQLLIIREILSFMTSALEGGGGGGFWKYFCSSTTKKDYGGMWHIGSSLRSSAYAMDD